MLESTGPLRAVWMLQHIQSPNQILLPAGSALKELRPWKLSTCSVCFLVVSFMLKHLCDCFFSGGREGGSNDTVDSQKVTTDMNPTREINLGFAAMSVFL